MEILKILSILIVHIYEIKYIFVLTNPSPGEISLTKHLDIMTNQVGEIELIYKSIIPLSQRFKMDSSHSAYINIYPMFDSDKIGLQESFILVLFNRANRYNGHINISKGSSTATVVDVKHIITSAAKSNTSSCIIAHNHPSGNMSPSRSDKQLTEKISNALKLIDVQLLDHIIVSPEKGKFYSLGDHGQL